MHNNINAMFNKGQISETFLLLEWCKKEKMSCVVAYFLIQIDTTLSLITKSEFQLIKNETEAIENDLNPGHKRSHPFKEKKSKPI